MVCKIFKNSCIGRLVLFNRCIVYLKYSCTKKRGKNVQKHVKTCKNVHLNYSLIKNVHLKYSFIKKTCKNVQKRAKNVQKRAKTCKNVQKCAPQVFLDPIQKRASSRSVQLEAVLLKALLYVCAK